MKKNPLFYFALLQIIFGYEWLTTGWGKIVGDQFVSSLPKTLEFFASKNPYDWYKNFLLGFATNNATLFGYLVQWGEFLAGLGLVAGALVIIFYKKELWTKIFLEISAAAGIGGAMMNAFYYFAAAWTSPSAHGVNMIMFWAQLIIVAALYEIGLRKKIQTTTPEESQNYV